MQKNTPTIRFILYENKANLAGNFPVFVRISFNRKKAELATGQYISKVSEWEPLTGRVKSKSQVNIELTRIEDALNGIISQLQKDGIDVTAKLIKERFLSCKNTSSTLISFVDMFISRNIVKSEDYAPGTIKNYIATKNHLTGFLSSIKNIEISISQFDYDHVQKFDFYLKASNSFNSEKKIKRNTVNKYHTKLKAIFNYAVEQNIITKNPYTGFSLKYEETHIQYLTKEELFLIEGSSLGENSSLIRVRDIFLFSVYTGLRFENAISLKEENIEFDGTIYWVNVMQKGIANTIGKRQHKVPILNRAKDILNKYSLEVRLTGYLLPKISNQKVNSYLKIIAEICGISKKLTHHIARHTFATTICMDNNIPIEKVGAFLGHQNYKSTLIYAKVSKANLSGVANELNNKL